MLGALILGLSLVIIIVGSAMLFWPRFLASAFLALNRTISNREVLVRRRPFLGIAFLSLGLALCFYIIITLFNTKRTYTPTTHAPSAEGEPTPTIARWAGVVVCLFIAGGAIRLLIDPHYIYKLRDSFVYYRDRWDQTPWPHRNARIVGTVVLFMSLWFLYRIVSAP